MKHVKTATAYRVFCVLSLCVAVLAATAGCAAQTDRFTVLTIGTADSGGSMFPASSVIAETLTGADDTIRFNISASTGSLENVQGLHNRSMDLALVSGDVALAAYEGRDRFADEAFGDLRAIAAVYVSTSNWMVLAESPIVYVHDLKGARAAVGPENSASERAALQITKLQGMSLSDVEFVNHGLGSGTVLLADGEVDAIHGLAGLPIPGMETLAAERECRLLHYTDAELKTVLSAEPGYFETVTPAGTYNGQQQDVKTFGTKCLLCVHAGMDEKLVYRLTQLLYTSSEELAESPLLSSFHDPSFAFTELPIPLHDGTIRFLESIDFYNS